MDQTPTSQEQTSRTPLEDTAPAGIGPAPAPAPFHVGEVLGDGYALSGILGSGGMGVVYEAHDLRLNREVAIKAPLYPELGEVLHGEAQALAAVRHPSMVTVYSMGSHRGIDYLVMERVHGMSLDRHLVQRAVAGQLFTLDETLDVLQRIAEGLAAVHNAGISHRDVKPSNVMLATGSRVMLMDFGLSCPAFQRTPAVVGSPGYMAPEVIMKRVAVGAGHLVDIYSLGAMAFHMLTGRLPFEGEPLEVMKQHVNAKLPDLRELRPEVPQDLAALVTEMLAKKPGDRPQHADVVMWSLRAMRRNLESSRPVNGPSRPFSVMIVDDDASMRGLLAASVRRDFPDASIVFAPSGEAAFSLYRKRAPDVLLLDLCLPKMSGFELCMYLQGAGLGGNSEVVIVSAAADDRDVQLLRQLGVARCLSKSEGLQEALRRTLDDVYRRRRVRHTMAANPSRNATIA